MPKDELEIGDNAIADANAVFDTAVAEIRAADSFLNFTAISTKTIPTDAKDHRLDIIPERLVYSKPAITTSYNKWLIGTYAALGVTAFVAVASIPTYIHSETFRNAARNTLPKPVINVLNAIKDYADKADPFPR